MPWPICLDLACSISWLTGEVNKILEKLDVLSSFLSALNLLNDGKIPVEKAQRWYNRTIILQESVHYEISLYRYSNAFNPGLGGWSQSLGWRREAGLLYRAQLSIFWEGAQSIATPRPEGFFCHHHYALCPDGTLFYTQWKPSATRTRWYRSRYALF